MTDEKLNLKPCPFCGRDMNTVSYSMKTRSFDSITMSLYTTLDIRCQCGLRMEIRSDNIGGKDVVKMWNTRANEPERICGNCKHFTPVEYERYGHCINDYGWQINPCQKACEEWEGKE